jgi:hypothetical protein
MTNKNVERKPALPEVHPQILTTGAWRERRTMDGYFLLYKFP